MILLPLLVSSSPNLSYPSLFYTSFPLLYNPFLSFRHYALIPCNSFSKPFLFFLIMWSHILVLLFPVISVIIFRFHFVTISPILSYSVLYRLHPMFPVLSYPILTYAMLTYPVFNIICYPVLSNPARKDFVLPSSPCSFNFS